MKRVLILLSDGFEAAAFTDVLGWADVYGSERIEMVTAGMQPRRQCTFGFTVIPGAQLSEIDPNAFDALAVPCGFETAGFYRDAYSESFLRVIQQFAEQGKTIASIRVAVLPLGKSGILLGRRATTYHLLDGKRRKQLADMGARVVDEPVVRDGNTSPATAIDVALALLESLTSQENAEHIREMLGFSQPGEAESNEDLHPAAEDRSG